MKTSRPTSPAFAAFRRGELSAADYTQSVQSGTAAAIASRITSASNARRERGTARLLRTIALV
jgi:hypothetical protein